MATFRFKILEMSSYSPFLVLNVKNYKQIVSALLLYEVLFAATSSAITIFSETAETNA